MWCVPCLLSSSMHKDQPHCLDSVSALVHLLQLTVRPAARGNKCCVGFVPRTPVSVSGIPDVFCTPVSPVCGVILDVDHGCSFCSSSSADIPEFMALTRAVVYYSAKDATSIDRRHLWTSAKCPSASVLHGTGSRGPSRRTSDFTLGHAAATRSHCARCARCEVCAAFR